MTLFFRKAFIFSLLVPVICFSREWPDVGGILDFSKPESISNRLFILTNPKSGSHLLLYSIMKITQRPLRGRVPLWHFENDPPFFPPENIMCYPLDFSKQTIYWGHEYHLLRPLNHSCNKLLFILRNYKENISSQLLLDHNMQDGSLNLGKLLLEEVLNEGIIFREYLERLKVFDEWDPNYKCLVSFEDLTNYPNYFVPQVLSFIEDDSNHDYFVSHYHEFKIELRERYREKGKDTGSNSDTSFFSKQISKEILQTIDQHVQNAYPDLWNKYLNQF